MLKKEGTHRITYLGFETTNTPLNLTLNFGNDENNFSVYDYINCYTEDSKEDNQDQGACTVYYQLDAAGRAE